MEHMQELDIEQFWKDNDISRKDNCFAKDAPCVALGLEMSSECFNDELNVNISPWAPNPPEVMSELAKCYNDKAEKVVGRRLVPEEYPAREEIFPKIKRIGEIFGGRYFYLSGAEYLEGNIKTPGELEKQLDNVEKMDMRSFVFPDNWDNQIKDIFEKTGKKPEPKDLGRHIRGPCTLATSILGVNNFVYFYYDEPELMKRFSRVMGDAIMRLNKEIDKACGYNEQNKPHGFSFADDNCYLITTEIYEDFGYPVLKQMFEHWSPDEGDMRYQHSDSAMGHLLPILGRLDFTGVNFGPTVLVDEIRKYMPHTRIDGCIAPFAFMRNETETIAYQAKRDCQMAVSSGIKGLNLATAGSVNPGSLLSSFRLVMQVIQNFGRY